MYSTGKSGDLGQPVTVSAGARKLGIDATAPLKDKHRYSRIMIPGVEKVDYDLAESRLSKPICMADIIFVIGYKCSREITAF